MTRRVIFVLFVFFAATFSIIWSGIDRSSLAQSNCDQNGVIVAQVVNPDPSVTGARPMQHFKLLVMPGRWLKLVGTEVNGRCFDYIGQKTDHVTLTAFMPVKLATELALQRWSQASPAEIKIAINTSKQERSVWLAPEDALALRRLGYILPISAKVLKPLQTYQFSAVETK